MTSDAQHGANSVEKVLAILLMFREHASLRPAQISAQLGVSRSTTHRLLAMLLSSGMIERGGETRAYHPGPALAELAVSASRQLDIVKTLNPLLRELSQSSGETAHVITLEGASCRFVDSVESTQALRTTSRIGTRYPAYVVSGGKALLAQLDGAALLELFPRPDLPALNERSLTSRAKLLTELEQIRVQGYATNFGESELGIAAVAVAVPKHGGGMPLALAVSAPETRLPAERVPELVAKLRAAAERVRMRLP